MSGVAMEALTLPEAESQFQPFCGLFIYFFKRAITSRGDDVITSHYRSGCMLIHASNAKYGDLMLEAQEFSSVTWECHIVRHEMEVMEFPESFLTMPGGQALSVRS